MKKSYIVLFIAAVGLLFACNSNDSSTEVVEISTPDKVNDDSEMTLLMRTIYDNYLILKDSIEQGKAIDRSLFNEVHRIYASTPTDSTILGPVFEGFEKNYLNTVDSFLLAESNKEMYFNISVQACISCHMEFCPGPLEKIKKLQIKPKQE